MISKYLGDKKFWYSMLLLALPIAFQNLLSSSLTLVDTIMVGSLGDTALSAVGIAGQVSWLLNIFCFGICSGGVVFISQYWGINDIKGIRRTYGLMLVSVLIISVLFFAPSLFYTEGIIKIFNRTPSLVEEGTAYLKIACFAYPATAVLNAQCFTLRATEKVKLPMYASIATTLINVVLNYALIFGKFGFPSMGVRGAALATVVSSWCGPIAIYVISVLEKNIIIAPFNELFGFNLNQVTEFYKKDFPVLVNEGMWGLGTVLYNVIFANLGHHEYGAVTILKTFENIMFIFFVGICNASLIMIGKYVGSGQIKEAKRDSLRFMIIIPLIAVFAGINVIIFRKYFINIFNLGGNLSELTLNTAMTIFMFYGIQMPIRNIPYIAVVGVFRPGGDTKTGTKIDMSTLWCMGLPTTAIAAFVLKLPFTMVFLTMYIFEDYLKAILCIKHYVSYKWIMPVTEEGKEGLRLYLGKS